MRRVWVWFAILLLCGVAHAGDTDITRDLLFVLTLSEEIDGQTVKVTRQWTEAHPVAGDPSDGNPPTLADLPDLNTFLGRNYPHGTRIEITTRINGFNVIANWTFNELQARWRLESFVYTRATAGDNSN